MPWPQAYQLDRKLLIVKPSYTTPLELSKFHSDEYIRFLQRIKPDLCFNPEFEAQLLRFNLGGDDCPIFDAMFEVRQCFNTFHPSRKSSTESHRRRNGTAGGMVPPASTRISPRLKCAGKTVQP